MRFRIIPLEERIVLDAAGAIDVLNSYHLESVGFARDGHTVDAHDIGPQAVKPVSFDSNDHHLIDAPISEDGGLHLMVIDTNVKNAEVLGSAAKDPTHVVYYDSSETSLKELSAKIATALHGQKADSIAFVSEGMEPGKFMLAGGQVVSLDAIEGDVGLQAFWDRVGSMINSGGRIDLLACNVAATEAGRDLIGKIDLLADSSNHDISVAASSNLTGNEASGGDWNLELGAIDAKAVYFNDHIQNWQGALAMLSVIKDINPGTGDGVDFISDRTEGTVRDQLVVTPNGTVFFVANRDQIWRSDGSDQGTVLVKDIPGGAPSNLTYSVAGFGLVYFTASDPVYGRELWRTDGTTAGTFRVTDINPGAGDSDPIQLTDRMGEIVFSARSGGFETTSLWGYIQGNPLKQIAPTGYQPYHVTYMNGSIYTISGASLDKYDGVSFTSVDHFAGNENTNVEENSFVYRPFTVLNDVLYFSGSSSYRTRPGGPVYGTGSEIWRSDGTTEGTYNLRDITPVSDIDSKPTNITAVGNQIFFTVTNWPDPSGSSATYSELWKTDGTRAGTVFVKRFGDGLNNYKPGISNLSALPAFSDHTNQAGSVNGLYVFYMGGISGQLWRSDGTEAGTYAIPGSTFKDVSNFTTSGNYMYYRVYDENSQLYHIYRTDGNTNELFFQGTQTNNPVVKHSVDAIYKAQNGIYFDGYDATYGEELRFYGDQQPIAIDEYVTIGMGGNYGFTLASLGANDIGHGPLHGELLAEPFVGAFHGNINYIPEYNLYVYIPDFGYSGTDVIYYRSVDANGLVSGNIGQINITIVNQPPVANPDTYYPTKTAILSVTDNDSDEVSSSLQVILMSNASHGNVVVSSDGYPYFIYTQDPSYTGEDSFTYALTDGISISNTTTVTLLPGLIANPDIINVAQNGTVSLDSLLLANDFLYFPNSTLSIVSGPSHGTLFLGGILGSTYTPNSGFYGTDSFTYKLMGDQFFTSPYIDYFSNTTTVTINVIRPNDSPIAGADNYSTPYNTILNVPVNTGVLANDTDPNSDPLHTQLVSGPAHGTLTLNANGSFSYTPTAGYSGADSFIYKAIDSFNGESAATTVSINVGPNLAIITNPDYYIISGPVSTYTAASVGFGLIGNDINPNNAPFLVEANADGPLPLGSVVINSNGTFTWTSPVNFSGTDSFGYKVYTQQDGVQYVSSGIAYMTVASKSFNDSYYVNKDVSSTLTISSANQGILANDWGWTNGSIYGPLQATLVSGPIHGSLTLNNNGTFSYTANSGFTGFDNFSYRSDFPGVNGSNIATVSIDVNGAPTANNSAVSVNEDGSVNAAVSFSGGFNTRTASVVSSVAHGLLTLQANGSYVYTPAANYFGSDSFTYKVTDSFGLQSNIATVNITINPVNDAPSFTRGVNVVFEDNASGAFTYAGWAKNISSGPNETDTLTFSITTDNDAIFDVLPSINPLNGDLTFTLKSGLVDPSAHATVTLNDGVGGTYVQTFDFMSGILQLVKDINAITGADAHPGLMTAVNGRIVFEAIGTASGWGLYATDGTVEGTVQLRNNHDGYLLGTNSAFTEANGKVFFGQFGEGGEQLWATDGTVAGTYLVKTFTNGSFMSGRSTEFNNAIYFDIYFYDVANSIEATYLYKSDGTEAGTEIVYTFAPGAISNYVEMNGKLYFQATDGVHGSELWSTDGTTAGTAMVADIRPGSSSGLPVFTLPPEVYNNKIYFIANDGLTGNEIWYSDGTAAGTQRLIDLRPGTTSTFNLNGSYDYFAVMNGELYFGVNSNATVAGLWKTDGTAAGTVRVSSDPRMAINGSYDMQFTVLGGNKLLFSSNSATDGHELWISDGTTAGTHVLKNIGAGAAGSNIASLTAIGNTAYFFANDGINAGYQFWKTDGTEAGTAIVQLAQPGVSTTNPHPVVSSGGKLYVSIELDSNVGQELYSIYGAINQSPEVSDFTVFTEEDSHAIIDLMAHIQDPDTDSTLLDVIIVNGPAHGALTLNGDGTYTYTPDANYGGLDSFTYKVSDGETESGLATVSLMVVPVDDTPVAEDFSVIVDEDGSVAIDLSAHISDVDSPDLITSIVTGPAHGSLVFMGGSYVYTPEANYHGSDSFTYKVSDGITESLATVSITVNSINDTPFANDFSLIVTEDVPMDFSFEGQYGDIDPDILTIHIVTPPSHGLLTLNGDGTYTYTPNSNYFGADGFSYRVSDGSTFSNEAVVFVSVASENDFPTAENFTVNATEDVTLIISLQGHVADPDNINLTTVLFSPPSHGTVTLNPDGSFNYKSASNYNGPDSFRYYVRDPSGFVSNIATITVNVVAVDDPPTALNMNVSTPEDQSVSINLFQNVIDFDSVSFTASIVNGPTHGTLTLESDGTYTYTPDANYYTEGVISDSFTYKVNDGTSDSNIATVEIFISGVNDAPVVADLQVDVQENGSVTFDLLSQVTDIDSSTFIPFIASLPLNGTLIQNEDNTITYTPFAGFSGTDSFQFKVFDDFGAQSNDGTVTITIGGVNDVPVANDVAIPLSEDGSVGIDLMAHVVDDSPNLNITILTGPTHGTLTLNLDGSYQYTPAANYFGSDSFTYKANDGVFDSNVATVSLDVAAVNDAPTAANFAVNATEDVVLNIGLQGHVADPDDSNFTTVLFSSPSHGTVNLNPDGSFNYKSASNYNGPDSFRYYVRDPSGFVSNIATITVNVVAVDDPPTALNMNVSTPEDQSVSINLFQNVIDFDSVSFTATIVNGPTHGTLTLESDGTYTYTPDANYYTEGVISDSFTYKVNDGASDSNIATVEIFISGVNDAPVVADLQVDVQENGSVTFDLLSQVTDIDSSTFIPFIASLPLNGTLIQNEDNTITYTPFAGFSGTDSFQFRVFDDFGAQSNDGIVTITIGGVNDVPVANDVTVSLAEDGSVGIDLMAHVVDDSPDLNITILTGPTHGTLMLNLDGSYQYTPAANYFGSDSFTYKVNDGVFDSNEATVTLTIAAVNDAPTASDLSVNTSEGDAVDISLSGQDIDSTNLTFSIISGPAHGTLTLNLDGTYKYIPNASYIGSDSFTYKANDGDLDSNIATATITIAAVNDAPTASDLSVNAAEDTAMDIQLVAQDNDSPNLIFSIISGPAHGTLSLNPDGSYKYTPNANYFGSDSFTYKANDGELDSNIATVSITVAAVNDAPTASNVSASTAEDTAVNINLAVQDVDSATLTRSIVTGPAHGTLTLNPDGSYKYTPNANYFGSDSFTYKANDGALDSNIATVSIIVAAVNDAPTASNVSVSTAEDTAVNINLGVQDVDSATLTRSIVTGPAHGTLSLNPDGSYKYTPNANYFGSDSFTYKANDGELDSNIATVSITVAAVNDAPTASNVSASTAEDTAVNINLAVQDVDSATLTRSIVTGPAHGTLSLNPDGSYKYTPNANYFGSDSFTYKANDGALDSNIATATINITSVNDAPVAVNDSYSTNEDTPLVVNVGTGLLANDSDVDNASLQALLNTAPAHGTLSLNANGSFSYTPNANFNGTDSFTYRASDGSANSIGVVSITVNSVNDAPVANNDAYTANAGSTLNVPARGVLANDTDIDSTALTAALITNPGHGSLILNADGSFSYTPTAGYSGADSFTYRTSDGSLQSNVATVAINVLGNSNIAPVLDINNGNRVYQEGKKPIILSTQADVRDPDTPIFNNGKLIVTIANNGSSSDRLTIENTANVRTQGSNVYHNGTLVGTFTGGVGTSPLVVTFNGAATQTIVERVTRQIGFSNVSDTPSTLKRTVTFQVADGRGGLSNTESLQVDVLSKNDAPKVSTSNDSAHVRTNVWTALSGITIKDVDSTSFTVAVHVHRGVLKFSDMNGLQNLDFKKTPTSSGLSTLQFTGSLSDVNLALSKLMYLSKYNYVGTDSIFIGVKDNNISKLGRSLVDAEVMKLHIKKL